MQESHTLTPSELNQQVRTQINRAFARQGYAPDVTQLAQELGQPSEDIETSLRHLADEHALVLHPNSTKVWVAHPFSAATTMFWVTAGERSWWGNCGWCALGIAALLPQEDVTIQTRSGGEAEPLTIHIHQGQLVEDDWSLNFCVPMSHLWDNVIYTCAMQLCFAPGTDIADWNRRHGISEAHAIPAAQAWQLAQRWYGHYLEPGWTKRTAEQAQATFESVGLVGDFWRFVP
jgi:hypothetical protein